jgi:hypothetical protein
MANCVAVAPQKCWLIHYHRGTLHYTVTLPVRQVYALYFLLAFLFILELLWKYLLPDLHPLLLLGSERLPWILKRSGQDITQPGPQYLDDKHCLPIWYCESCSVTVEDENPSIHLSTVSSDTLSRRICNEHRSEHRRRAMQSQTPRRQWSRGRCKT